MAASGQWLSPEHLLCARLRVTPGRVAPHPRRWGSGLGEVTQVNDNSSGGLAGRGVAGPWEESKGGFLEEATDRASGSMSEEEVAQRGAGTRGGGDTSQAEGTGNAKAQRQERAK